MLHGSAGPLAAVMWQLLPRNKQTIQPGTLVNKSPVKIAVIPGDGTGPEVTAEALKVLKAVAPSEGIQYELTPFDFGGERYLRTGETLPEGAVDELRKFDAIFLGAVGHPQVAPGVLEKGLLL